MQELNYVWKSVLTAPMPHLNFFSIYHFSFDFYGNRFVKESKSYLARLLYCDSISGRLEVVEYQLQKSNLVIEWNRSL